MVEWLSVKTPEEVERARAFGYLVIAGDASDERILNEAIQRAEESPVPDPATLLEIQQNYLKEAAALWTAAGTAFGGYRGTYPGYYGGARSRLKELGVSEINAFEAELAAFLALGIDGQGSKDVLGMWIEESEGAKFWLHVLTELKNRGVRDIFIGCVDGLKGFPESMQAVFPATQVQLCLVHMVRHSLAYVGWKERKAVAADLKLIYRAATEAEAEQALSDFEVKWDRKYPSISRSWRTNWPE